MNHNNHEQLAKNSFVLVSTVFVFWAYFTAASVASTAISSCIAPLQTTPCSLFNRLHCIVNTWFSVTWLWLFSPSRLGTNLACRSPSAQTLTHTHPKTVLKSNLSLSSFQLISIFISFVFCVTQTEARSQYLQYTDIKKDYIADIYKCTSSLYIHKDCLDSATSQSEGCLSNLKATAGPIIKQRSSGTQEMTQMPNAKSFRDVSSSKGYFYS